VEAIRQRLRDDPIFGPRLILLVPEQASLQMERALITGEEVGAAHRAEVLSFRRLAYRVMDSAGGTARRALSEPARAMVLRQLLAKHRPKLRYFRRVERAGGFIGQLSDTIAEFFNEAVAPDDIGPIEDVAAGEEAIQAKLHDLRLIYATYLDYLGDERLDPSQHLHVACEAIPRCPWLAGAELWVDGFATLSGQEKRTLIALSRMCSRVHVSMLLDPSLIEGSPDGETEETASSLFAQTHQTYLDLVNIFERAGLQVGDPIVLHRPESRRFIDSHALARVERRIFTAQAEAKTESDECDGAAVQLAECPTRRVEVEYAVAQVVRWVQDQAKPYRYRDIAVIARDLQPYHDLMSAALSARGIPYFIDRRRSIAHLPLVEWLRGVAALSVSPYELEPMRLLLKTGLLPIESDAADELENHLLAHGICGWQAWHVEAWTHIRRESLAEVEDAPSEFETSNLESVNAARRALIELFDGWIKLGAQGRSHTGEAWADAIRRLMESSRIDRRLQHWADAAEQDGQLDTAEEHRQVWRDTSEFLDDLAFSFTDTPLSINELADVIDAGLSRLTLGLAPPMLDQVLVGSIDRSRHPNIKAAIILGFNDGVFPARIIEDSILNDDDRQMLARGGVSLGVTGRQRVLAESLLAYIAVTRPSEKLLITYASTDEQGKELRPSPYVAAVKAACPTIETIHVGDPVRKCSSWDILTPRDLVSRLAIEYRTRHSPDQDCSDRRGQWNALYEAHRTSCPSDEHTRRALAGLGSMKRAALSGRSVARLYRTPLPVSVSQLEAYAACPFKHFSQHVLRLRERPEATYEPVDVGKVHHAILEDFIGALISSGRELATVADGDVASGLNDSWHRVAARLSVSANVTYARDTYILRRSASQLARVMRAQRSASGAGRARPYRTEVPFGVDAEGALPAVELNTPAGRRVLLRGYIDRVDLAELADEMLGVVIDYKRSGGKRLDLSEVYHGISLQLIGYLLVLAELGTSLADRPVQPAAAFYLSLTPNYESVKHPSDAADVDPSHAGTEKPRGIINTRRIEALDSQLTTGQSGHYNVYIKKDGRCGRIDASDAADDETFQALLDHTRYKMGALADRVLDGDVAVHPYRLGDFSPCSWCSYRSVCRYEIGLYETRYLPKYKRSVVFERLKASSPKSTA